MQGATIGAQWQELCLYFLHSVLCHESHGCEFTLTNKQAVGFIQKPPKWFLFLFNFSGTGDNDLYINQAVVFIEDAIQVNITCFLAITLPMLDTCHMFC